MASVKVKLVSEIDDLPARALEVQHKRGAFKTPVRSIKVSELELREVDIENQQGIIEIYRSFPLAHLNKAYSDLKVEERIESQINRSLRDVRSEEMVVMIPNVEAKPSAVIDNPERCGEYLLEITLASRVDLICTPMFYRINEKYVIPIVDGFLEAVASINRPVALTIPEVSKEARDKIVSLYFKKANKYGNFTWNFICVDYYGSNPITKYAKHNFALSLSRKLERETGEPVVIYGANVKYSRTVHKYDEVPARDLISPYVNLDILGPNHRRPVISREVAQKLKELKERLKLLNIERYTYVNLSKIIEERVPLYEMIISNLHVSGNKLRQLVDRYNAEKAAIEISRTRKLFVTKERDPKKYLFSKHVFKMDSLIRERLELYLKLVNKYRKSKALTEWHD